MARFWEANNDYLLPPPVDPNDPWLAAPGVPYVGEMPKIPARGGVPVRTGVPMVDAVLHMREYAEMPWVSADPMSEMFPILAPTVGGGGASAYWQMAHRDTLQNVPRLVGTPWENPFSAAWAASSEYYVEKDIEYQTRMADFEYQRMVASAGDPGQFNPAILGATGTWIRTFLETAEQDVERIPVVGDLVRGTRVGFGMIGNSLGFLSDALWTEPRALLNGNSPAEIVNAGRWADEQAGFAPMEWYSAFTGELDAARAAREPGQYGAATEQEAAELAALSRLGWGYDPVFGPKYEKPVSQLYGEYGRWVTERAAVTDQLRDEAERFMLASQYRISISGVTASEAVEMATDLYERADALDMMTARQWIDQNSSIVNQVAAGFLFDWDTPIAPLLKAATRAPVAGRMARAAADYGGDAVRVPTDVGPVVRRGVDAAAQVAGAGLSSIGGRIGGGIGDAVSSAGSWLRNAGQSLTWNVGRAGTSGLVKPYQWWNPLGASRVQKAAQATDATANVLAHLMGSVEMDPLRSRSLFGQRSYQRLFELWAEHPERLSTSPFAGELPGIGYEELMSMGLRPRGLHDEGWNSLANLPWTLRYNAMGQIGYTSDRLKELSGFEGGIVESWRNVLEGKPFDNVMDSLLPSLTEMSMDPGFPGAGFGPVSQGLQWQTQYAGQVLTAEEAARVLEPFYLQMDDYRKYLSEAEAARTPNPNNLPIASPNFRYPEWGKIGSYTSLFGATGLSSENALGLTFGRYVVPEGLLTSEAAQTAQDVYRHTMDSEFYEGSVRKLATLERRGIRSAMHKLFGGTFAAGTELDAGVLDAVRSGLQGVHVEGNPTVRFDGVAGLSRATGVQIPRADMQGFSQTGFARMLGMAADEIFETDKQWRFDPVGWFWQKPLGTIADWAGDAARAREVAASTLAGNANAPLSTPMSRVLATASAMTRVVADAPSFIRRGTVEGQLIFNPGFAVNNALSATGTSWWDDLLDTRPQAAVNAELAQRGGAIYSWQAEDKPAVMQGIGSFAGKLSEALRGVGYAATVGQSEAEKLLRQNRGTGGIFSRAEDFLAGLWFGETAVPLGTDAAIGFGERSNRVRTGLAGTRKALDAIVPGKLEEFTNFLRTAGMEAWQIQDLRSIFMGSVDVGTAASAHFLRDATEYVKGLNLGPERTDTLMRHLQTAVAPGLMEVSAVATEAGAAASRFTMLDPSYTSNFQEWLAPVTMYSYFRTQSLVNWVQRLAAEPGLVADLARMERGMETENRNEEVPQRLQGTVPIYGELRITAPWRKAVPMDTLTLQEWNEPVDDPGLASGLLSTAGWLGLTLDPTIKSLLRMGTGEDAGLLTNIPQARLVFNPENMDYIVALRLAEMVDTGAISDEDAYRAMLAHATQLQGGKPMTGLTGLWPQRGNSDQAGLETWSQVERAVAATNLLGNVTSMGAGTRVSLFSEEANVLRDKADRYFMLDGAGDRRKWMEMNPAIAVRWAASMFYPGANLEAGIVELEGNLGRSQGYPLSPFMTDVFPSLMGYDPGTDVWAWVQAEFESRQKDAPIAGAEDLMGLDFIGGKRQLKLHQGGALTMFQLAMMPVEKIAEVTGLSLDDAKVVNQQAGSAYFNEQYGERMQPPALDFYPQIPDSAKPYLQSAPRARGMKPKEGQDYTIYGVSMAAQNYSARVEAEDMYVYALLDPDGQVRYIGQTNEPQRRFVEHLMQAFDDPRHPKSQWLLEIYATGRFPTMQVIESGLSERMIDIGGGEYKSEVDLHEEMWIGYMNFVADNKNVNVQTPTFDEWMKLMVASGSTPEGMTTAMTAWPDNYVNAWQLFDKLDFTPGSLAQQAAGLPKAATLPDLPHIGKVSADKLIAAGLPTVQAVAHATPEQVAAATGFTLDKSREVILAAIADTPNAFMMNIPRVLNLMQGATLSTAKTLEDLDGVGPATAGALRAAGVMTIDDVAQATVEQLAAVSGISESGAARMIAEAGTLAGVKTVTQSVVLPPWGMGSLNAAWAAAATVQPQAQAVTMQPSSQFAQWQAAQPQPVVMQPSSQYAMWMQGRPTLEDLDGVGPKLAERLTAAGYGSFAAVAGADVKALDSIEGISMRGAVEIINSARTRLGMPLMVAPPEADTEGPPMLVTGLSAAAGLDTYVAKKIEEVEKGPKVISLYNSTDLSALPGVGDVMASRLNAAGYTTIERLANTNPEVLAEVQGLSLTSAAAIVQAARRLATTQGSTLRGVLYDIAHPPRARGPGAGPDLTYGLQGPVPPMGPVLRPPGSLQVTGRARGPLTRGAASSQTVSFFQWLGLDGALRERRETAKTQVGLIDLPHVGEVMAERLRAAGLGHLGLVATAEPERLDAVQGISPKQAVEIIAAAREILHLPPVQGLATSAGGATAEAGPAPMDPRDLEVLTGIGATKEQRLQEAGYRTIEDIARADPAAIALVNGISDDGAVALVREAQMLMGSSSGALYLPFEGEIDPVQGFGENAQNYVRFGLIGHEGTDYMMPVGTSLQSAGAGTVAKVGYDASGYGNYLIVQHADGSQTLYAHMDSVDVAEGDPVTVATVLGLSGDTGNSSGPHLHLGYRPPGANYGNGFRGFIDTEGRFLARGDDALMAPSTVAPGALPGGTSIWSVPGPISPAQRFALTAAGAISAGPSGAGREKEEEEEKYAPWDGIYWSRDGLVSYDSQLRRLDSMGHLALDENGEYVTINRRDVLQDRPGVPRARVQPTAVALDDVAAVTAASDRLPAQTGAGARASVAGSGGLGGRIRTPVTPVTSALTQGVAANEARQTWMDRVRESAAPAPIPASAPAPAIRPMSYRPASPADRLDLTGVLPAVKKVQKAAQLGRLAAAAVPTSAAEVDAEVSRVVSGRDDPVVAAAAAATLAAAERARIEAERRRAAAEAYARWLEEQKRQEEERRQQEEEKAQEQARRRLFGALRRAIAE